MSKIKVLLLGTASGLCGVPGAQAADLPVTKAAPVEYVRVCSTHGRGFFYIPGTDTCIKIGGRARFEYQYNGPLQKGVVDHSGYRGLGRLEVDARTATDWGTLRTFVRFEIASRTGASFFSGGAQRQANAFTATGVDTYGRAQKWVDVDKAFIQFGGLTAGRFASFYDFYAHSFELIGITPGSDVASTNGIAYSFDFGSGVTATLSVEDPIYRRNPVYYNTSGYANQVPGAFYSSSLTGLPYVGTTFQAPVGLTFDPATGLPTSYAAVDIAQRSQVPDVIAALRYDGDWGSAQISAALHQISIGQFVSTTTPGATVNSSGVISGPGGSSIYGASANTSSYTVANGLSGRRPSAEYGYAVQAGVKFNLPSLAPGDALYLQAAYSRGALLYVGASPQPGISTPTGALSAGSPFSINTNDAYVDAFGKLKLTESFSFVAAFLHYWTPTVRQAVFGGYSGAIFGKSARSVYGPLYAGLGGSVIPLGGIATVQQAVNYAYSPLLKDWTHFHVGSNVVWSPVQGLDLGLEVGYTRVDPSGRVVDQNKNVTFAANGISYPKTISSESLWEVRARVQRDF